MPDEAWEFVKFMTSFESFKYRAIERRLHPARKAILDDPEVQEAIPVLSSWPKTFFSITPRRGR